jgi:thiol-disulfide isomerase/thioredoxin/mono/diheme cytochrome c family protein
MFLRSRFAVIAVVVALAAVTQVFGEEPVQSTAIGAKVGTSHELRDLRGTRRALSDFGHSKTIVLAFLGCECPISNLYVPRLIELEKSYRSKQVQFLAVYSNDSEDLDQIAGHSYDRDVPFPVLKDVGQQLAGAAGATRVPAVVVLDADMSVRYRGRIDDQYGSASRRQKPTRDDLQSAIEEVLAGKKVSVPETPVDGCLIERSPKSSARRDVTFAKDVARIMQQRCQNCHRPGQSAPFSLLTFDDVVKRGRMIREVTTQKRMPPWHADGRFGQFMNDRRMTKDEIATVAAWVDAGMPRGNDKDMPAPAKFVDGWAHGKPDLVISMPQEYEVPATGSLPYQHWEIDPGFTEDKWITVAEARPGVASVVHHIVVYILAPGQRQPFLPDGTLSVLVGWAPGDLGTVCPPDTAMRIPKGSRFRFEMHYTPSGSVVKDRSSVGITFAPKPPRFEMFTNAFANETIQIPPHDPHYRAEATLRFRGDARILSFVPHMHWRGKNYFYEVIYPDGKREPLLSVPRWDFNWQNVYQLKEPMKLPKGAKLHAVAHWDNSKNNPLNPAPEKSPSFGLQTWDEMMVGWVAYVWERPEIAAEMAKNPVSQADAFFDRLDRNGDDVVTPDEIPAQLKPAIALTGVKVPEKMTRADFVKLFEELRKMFPRQPQPKKPDGEKKQ